MRTFDNNNGNSLVADLDNSFKRTLTARTASDPRSDIQIQVNSHAINSVERKQKMGLCNFIPWKKKISWVILLLGRIKEMGRNAKLEGREVNARGTKKGKECSRKWKWK